MSMTTFHAVNAATMDHAMRLDDIRESTTPTTPRPPGLPIHQREVDGGRDLPGNPSGEPRLSNTPTGQRTISDPSVTRESTAQPSNEGIRRDNSQRSTQSNNTDEMDVDGSDDEQDGSGDETEGGDSGRPSKKKKGLRFFCTDFPPCNLSFTRSEHLARHIRKHTGERPFQCHCNRRFSRLDNLRQHAQTVHVNEEIPGDSLAATGTRFQRQIRTDRVRPPGRARAGTGGSHAGHSRGHSRNLSTSSIGSTASTFTAAQEAPKRRPPPLIMANESSRVRLNQDAMNSPPSTPPSQFQTYSGNSPGFSTPTSATFSTGLGSPGFGSSYASPASSRNPSFYGTRTPGRRLSVPSGTNPFQSPHGSAQPPPHLSPLASSAASFSNNGSVFASPTSSTFSFIRGDPAAAAEAEWRRRTWHPNTLTSLAPNYSRPATSSLSYSQTPDAPQPAFAPNATAAAGQAPRLPGIESFDQVQHRPSTPPRRRLSPMQIDQSQPPPQVPPPRAPGHVPFQRGHHRGHVSWDLGLHSNLTRLERARDVSQWSQQTIDEIQHSSSRPSQATQVLHNPDGGSSGTSSSHPPAAFEISQGQPPTPRRNKRFGWYNGPTTPVANLASRTTPEDSSGSEGVPTPGTSVAEYQPAIVHSNGYVETQRPQLPADGLSNNCTPQLAANSGYVLPTRPAPQAAYFIPRGPPANDMGRLEALVAVATSEEKAATAAR